MLKWLNAQIETDLYLSVVTFGELEKGIAKLISRDRREHLAAWVRTDLAHRFQGRIISIDYEVGSLWGRLQGEAEAAGRPLPVVDTLLSATALAHHMTMVTRNAAHFEQCGVSLLNPWG